VARQSFTVCKNKTLIKYAMKTFKELLVWQKSMLSNLIRSLKQKKMPDFESNNKILQMKYLISKKLKIISLPLCHSATL
jgi:hypothetical protein